MNHFLDISQLSLPLMEALIARALVFKKQQTPYPCYPEKPVVTLFHETSTRTQVSFALAAQHLAMPCIPLPVEQSSLQKGETLEDTMATLAAMGIWCCVIRHPEAGLPQRLADKLGDSIHLVNAGDGMHAHPSQALLDMMTIIEQKPDRKRLKIALLGDLRHSRVANSFQLICKAFGVGELLMIAPTAWQPDSLHYGVITADIREGLRNADVILCLRVQKERLSASEQLDLSTYRRDFALTRAQLAYAKPDAMVMHPGPINRGVEIDSSVADGKHSFILNQVKNGVYMRMAILEALG